MTQMARSPRRRGAPGKSPERKDTEVGVSKKPWKCEDCDHLVLTLHHQVTYTGKKPFRLPKMQPSHRPAHAHSQTAAHLRQVRKAFSQGSELTLHQRTHTWVCPYACPEYNKAFHNHAYLIQHHIVHTSEQPYKCGCSSTAFSFSSTLIWHQRVDKTPHDRVWPVWGHPCPADTSDLIPEVVLEGEAL